MRIMGFTYGGGKAVLDYNYYTESMEYIYMYIHVQSTEYRVQSSLTDIPV